MKRTVEDRLREEYFDILPEIEKVAAYIEAKTKCHLLPITSKLEKFEQIVISTRIKSCESSLDALRRRSEGRIFDPDKEHTLTQLRDLAGVRVLAFPRNRIEEIDKALQELFPLWTSDPVQDDQKEIIAFKYWGKVEVSDKIGAEYQIVSSPDYSGR